MADTMSRSIGHFENFKPHTLYKHRILRTYFLAWGFKLGLRDGSGDVILYVDACAGRGMDDLGNQGSPLIAAVAAAQAGSGVGHRRGRAFHIHVVALEAKRSYFKTLAALLTPFEHVQVLHGTLSEHLAALDLQFPAAPALIFVDPFGLKPLNASVIQKVLAGDGREALLLFADQAALRHFGAIVALETTAERRHRIATKALPMFPDLDPPNATELATAAAESRAQLEVTREKAIEILNAAFGDTEWQSEIEAAPQAQRRQAFLEAYSARLRTWGAKYVLPIPVVDASGSRAYTLIHASQRPKAYAAMKEAVAHSLSNSQLPVSVVEQMRQLVCTDIESVTDLVCRRFRGQTVRWAELKENRNAPCIRNFALEETPAFPFELDALKNALKHFKVPGRALNYCFPEG